MRGEPAWCTEVRRRPYKMIWLGLALTGIGAEPVEGFQRRTCDGAASLAVTVRDDSGQLVIPAATVVLRWTDADRRPVRRAVDADGRLLLCVPRAARRAVLWAELGDASSEEALVVVEPGIPREVELRLLFSGVSTGRIIGQVRDGRNHRPVAAAHVSVPGRTETVESNRRGYFVLSGLPVGEHELSVRHIGYAPLIHPIRLARGRTTEALIELSPDPVELEPLVATATRSRRLELQGFYDRKYWGELAGGGHFFTAADIERRNPVRISHMIAEVPSVRLGNCGLRANNCKLYGTRISEGFTGQGCRMNIFIDGHLVIRGSDERWAAQRVPRWMLERTPKFRETINDYIITAEVAGIEVYTGAASIPAEFSGYDARCGAVVVWTK